MKKSDKLFWLGIIPSCFVMILLVAFFENIRIYPLVFWLIYIGIIIWLIFWVYKANKEMKEEDKIKELAEVMEEKNNEKEI